MSSRPLWCLQPELTEGSRRETEIEGLAANEAGQCWARSGCRGWRRPGQKPISVSVSDSSKCVLIKSVSRRQD